METPHQPHDIIAQRYRIVAPLGQGAFGTTYEAEDLTNYQRVAIKALSLSQLTDWKSLDLFEREARVLANLDHPAIPKYLDYFHEETAEDCQFYLVQELVVGESLAALVKKGWHGNEDEIKQIAVQVLEILDYLHRLNPAVIHRDIKPQNIIRRSDGQVYLVDFGAVQDDYRRTLIRGGTFVGTLGYMPPEQFRGQVFFASDLYALGATILFLLTHRSPADLPQSRMKIDFRSRVQISPEFADWLEKMLEPTVEDRFKSAAEARNALQTPRSLSNIENHSLFSRRQPKGSRIVLNKTNKRLVVKIPPAGWRTEGIALLALVALFFDGLSLLLGFGFCLLIYSFTAQVKAGNLEPVALLMTLFFLMMYFFFILPIPLLLSLIMSWGVVEAFMRSTYLEIDSSYFRLGWKCLCFSRQVQGYTADIDRLEGGLGLNSAIRDKELSELSKDLYELSSVEKSPSVWSALKHTIREIKRQPEFAAEVTPVEKEWLVTEISEFLEQIKSDR